MPGGGWLWCWSPRLAAVLGVQWSAWYSGAGAGDWAAIAAGAVGLVGGVVLLAMSRRLSERSAERAEAGVAAASADAAPPGRAPWSVGSVASAGLAVAAMGYHLIVWTLPAGAFGVRVPASAWWAVPVAGVAMVGLSRWLDGAEWSRRWQR